MVLAKRQSQDAITREIVGAAWALLRCDLGNDAIVQDCAYVLRDALLRYKDDSETEETAN